MNLVLPSSLAGQGLLWSSWEVHCSLALVLGVRAKLDTVHLAPTLSPTLPRSMCELGCPCPNLAAYRCLLMKGPGAESSACGQGAKQKPSVTLAQHTVYSFLGGWVGGDKNGRVCFLYSNKNMFWKVGFFSIPFRASASLIHSQPPVLSTCDFCLNSNQRTFPFNTK